MVAATDVRTAAPADAPPARARPAAPAAARPPSAGSAVGAGAPQRTDALAATLARSVVARNVPGAARSELGARGRGVVQREATIEEDAKKLDFIVSRFGTEAKKVFVNATEEQVDASVRLVDAAWRDEYNKAEKLTLAQATKVPPRKALLKELGKTGADLEKPASYQLLVGVMSETFADEADHAYNYKPSKVGKVKLGTEWALELVHNDSGAIEPEDKSLDPRLVADTMNENIVKTGADTADTATVLYEIKNPKARDEIEADASVWELHGHVRKDGDVDFAHTKKDNAHFQVVNEWFKKNIPVEDREWA